MIALFRKEINSFFSSLTGYIVIILFLLVNSFTFWIWTDDNILATGYANMDSFFQNAPYIFLLLIPAVTMRSFAEEKSTGTIESLVTKPISETKIILAKYFASLVLVAFAIIPTFIYYISLYYIGQRIYFNWAICFFNNRKSNCCYFIVNSPMHCNDCSI